MFRFGRPEVNSVTLMPWMPSEVAASVPKSDWRVSGFVLANPKRNSFTTVGPKMCVQLKAPPCVVRRVFWIPATNGPRSKREAAKSGVGRQQAACPCGASSWYLL